MTPQPSDDAFEAVIEERLEELQEDVPAERALLARAIGGWRGMIDSGAPAAIFLLVYSFNGQQLDQAVWAAVAIGAVIVVLRLIRRESLTQIIGGFAGVAVSAFIAARTGQAEDFFIPGLLTNLAYGLGALISVLVGWPLMGFMVGGLTGSLTQWRSDRALRRVYATATWVWVGVFGGRLLVQVPLYLAGQVEALGVAKIVMGWPLFLLGAWLNYLIIRPVLAQRRAEATASPAPDPKAAEPNSDAQAPNPNPNPNPNTQNRP